MGAKFFKRFKEPEFIEKIGKDFKKNIAEGFGPELLNLLDKGISPVKESKNRQPEYSESYKKQIKRDGLGVGKKVRPVNLKLTGDLHKSLKIDISKENPVVTFTDEKAEYHNDIGVGKQKVKRRLLPTGTGEEFTLRLFQKIINALKDAIKYNI